jgi:hypothetical protein
MGCYSCKFIVKTHEETDKDTAIYFCRERGEIISPDQLSEGCGEWLDKKTKWYDP